LAAFGSGLQVSNPAEYLEPVKQSSSA